MSYILDIVASSIRSRRLSKDAVAADVHATTALGNEDDKAAKPKPKTPTIVGNGKGQKLPVTGMTAAAMAVQQGQQQDHGDDQQQVGKAGARHSRSDLTLLQTIHDHACSLGAKCATDGVDPDASGSTYVKRDTDWSIPLTIAKADPDKRLIFGWASVVEKDGQSIVDKQGDIIPVEELEKGAYDFMLHSRENDDLHVGGPTGRCVESVVFTKEKQAALGIDLGKIGWWVGFKVDDDNLWAAHKRGERPEFSIGGGAVREPTA